MVCSLSSFQICNTVLLTIVTMLFIISPGLEVCTFSLLLPVLPTPSLPNRNLFSRSMSLFVCMFSDFT